MFRKISLLAFYFIFCASPIFAYTVPEGFGCDFHQAMSSSDEYFPELVSRGPWRVAYSLYNHFSVNNIKHREAPRIPKIIHQIWLGSPFPEKYKKFQKTWQQHHPDWEYRLWTDKDIEEFGLVNKKIYDQTENYGAKSDIARYEILYRIGGLYVDTDFECLRSFDFFHHCCDFYAGLSSHAGILLYNGLIGSAPGHPILLVCIHKMEALDREFKSTKELQKITGPHFFTRCSFRALRVCNGPILFLPVNYFYPWPRLDEKKGRRTREQILSWVRPESFAIHHWHASWAW